MNDQPQPMFSAEFVQRFLRRIKKCGADECWPWVGSNNGRYGTLTIARKPYRAHRIAYAIAHGALPEAGIVVMHRCDNPRCCNPAHLLAGTQSDNMLDASRKARMFRGLGSANGKAKLSVEIVREIKRSPHEKTGELARRLGITVSNLKSVRSGRTWSWVVL